MRVVATESGIETLPIWWMLNLMGLSLVITL